LEKKKEKGIFEEKECMAIKVKSKYLGVLGIVLPA